MLVWLRNMKKYTTLLHILLVLALIGVLDSGYLTYEHYSNAIPPCSDSPFVDCGKVLKSEYSEVFGFPLAGLGLLHYSALLAVITFVYKTRNVLAQKLMVLQASAGALFSVYFVYLQVGVIGAICLYCMVSAINSFILLPFAVKAYKTYEHAQKPLQKEEK